MFRKQNKAGGIMLLDFRQYYKAIVKRNKQTKTSLKLAKNKNKNTER